MPNSIQSQITDLKDRIAAIEKIIFQEKVKTTDVSKTTSPKEFLLEISCKTVWQKTLAVAYYHETILGKGGFSATDLEKIFYSAKEKQPTNINDMVNANIKKGYIMDDLESDGKQKSWVLTSSGEKAIMTKFGNDRGMGESL